MNSIVQFIKKYIQLSWYVTSFFFCFFFLADFAPNGSVKVDRLKYCSAVLFRWSEIFGGKITALWTHFNFFTSDEASPVFEGML